MAFAYSDYLATISKKFCSLFDEIRTDYNFDYGDEFEIAICKALRVILPNKYGICRGSVFTLDNKTIGDDIIIFDQWAYPVLRLLEDNDYAQKQHIPIEAVITYIEAKNTVVLEDGHGNSLKKAVGQAIKIKNIGRKEMRLNPFVLDMNDEILDRFEINRADGYPQIDNPFYTCVFSRGVRQKPNSKLLNASEIDKILTGMNLAYGGQCVDLLVLHDDIVLFPVINETFFAPFWINGKTNNYKIIKRKDMAWGIAISLLFYAFDGIRLGRIKWKDVFAQMVNWPDEYKE